MSPDYSTPEALQRNHPAWRLLLADHAPLVASFLHRVFVLPNVRMMAQPELVSKLEDELYHLRESQGDGAFPKSAAAYNFRSNTRIKFAQFPPRVAQGVAAGFKLTIWKSIDQHKSRIHKLRKIYLPVKHKSAWWPQNGQTQISAYTSWVYSLNLSVP